MGFFDFLKRKTEEAPQQMPTPTAPQFEAKATIATEKLMTSQLAALYLHDWNLTYRDIYLQKLTSIGIPLAHAQKLFQFECDVIKRYDKPYLLDPSFTRDWFFGLKAPFFQAYPKTKMDILQERSLTVSEICKLIDEAEWHFYNSHERELPDGVWPEIYAWRMSGAGGEFAMQYFEKIASDAGVSMDSLAALSNEQGSHLDRHKWSAR